MIYFLSEADVTEVVNQEQVNAAVEQCFSSLAADSAFNFPVVRRPLDYADAIFGFKSGFDVSGPTLGIKAGGLWPGNRRRGVPNHQSTIVLFDAESGAPAALVCGTYLTGLRTASASALSVRHLARENSRTLGITAAGGQAAFQVRACFAERNFERVLLPARDSGGGEALKKALEDLPATVEVRPMETLCRESDVLVTMALSFDAYVRKDWIQPGTHVACMGTDSVGKQEVDAALLSGSRVFGDAPDQNARLGECQHAVAAGLLDEEQIVPLGCVINGDHPGREDAGDITLFDSTGMGLQDVAAARLAVENAVAAGRFIALDQWGDASDAAVGTRPARDMSAPASGVI